MSETIAIEPTATAHAASVGSDTRSPLSLAVAIALTLVLPVILWLAPLGIEPHAQKALAIASFMIGAWITHALDHGIAGIIGCYLFWMFGVVNFQSAFGGFAETTPWFLFAAIMFGLMATKSGLARRMAYWVMRAVGHSYSRLLLGLILSDFLLTIIVPSGIARVVIMAAIAIGLIEAFGVGKGSNIARGMFIILVYTATIFDKMIIAGAASITARGLIERVGEVKVLWSQWFLAYLPCDLLTIVVAWRLTLWLYPPEMKALPGGPSFLSEELHKMGSLSRLEIKSALLMGLGIILWMTDFIHHIPSPMIGMGVGLLAVVPALGVLNTEDVRKINFLPIFFVASAISMSHVLAETGRAEPAHGRAVRLDGAVHHQRVELDVRALLVGLLLSHHHWRRDLHARDVDARADELREGARPRPAGARDDLDVRRGRESLHLPVGGARRGILVRLFQRQGHVQGRPRADGGGVHHLVLPCADLVADDRPVERPP